MTGEASRGRLDLDALVAEHGGGVGGDLADVLVLEFRIIGPQLVPRPVLADRLQDAADRPRTLWPGWSGSARTPASTWTTTW